MKKINTILGFAIAVLLLVQMAVLFLPYFTVGDNTYSIQNAVWDKVPEVNKAFVDEANAPLSEDDDPIEIPVNTYGPMLGLTFLMSIATLISLLASRKAIFPAVFSVAWGGVATYTYLTTDILTTGNATLRLVHIILIVIADVLILARLYPWFCVRFRKKK